MEIENENENNDITAKELYDKLVSWNKDLEKIIKEGKKK